MGCRTSRPKKPRSSAAGARVEAPEALRGWGVEKQCPLPQWGRGLRRGQCPSPPKKILTLDLQMVTFGAFWCFFLQFSGLFYTQKLVLLGL